MNVDVADILSNINPNPVFLLPFHTPYFISKAGLMVSSPYVLTSVYLSRLIAFKVDNKF
jgi:hypothetical protein